MKIYTSYYGNRSLDAKKHFLVQVSNSAPANITTQARFQEVVPDWKRLVKPYKEGLIDKTSYTRRYMDALDKTAFGIILRLEDIIEKAGGKDIVLLCYEKPSSFCHRHLLAKWLEDNARRIPYEIGEIRELGMNQLNLF